MLQAERDRLVKIMKENKNDWHQMLDSGELQDCIRIFSDEFMQTVAVADPKSGRVSEKNLLNFEYSPQEIYDRVTASQKYREVLKK